MDVEWRVLSFTSIVCSWLLLWAVQIMRTCACFVVVEYMRHGMDVQEACARAIQRIVGLKKAPAEFRTHTSLVVGIVAMDKNGKVGAASTLSPDNRVGSNPYFQGLDHFPVSCWSEGEHSMLKR